MFADLPNFYANDAPQATIPSDLLITSYRPDIVIYNTKCPSIALLAVIVCAGDLNLPDICWSTSSVCGYRYPLESNNITLDLVSDCGFTQMVELPTRGSNLLDILFTNRPTLIHRSGPVPGISDHDIILTTFQMKASYQENTARKIFLWNSLNHNDIKTKLLALKNYYTSVFTEDTPR